MAITLSTVDLSEATPHWATDAQINAGLVADLQSTKGLYTGQGLRDTVVLYSTQFESMAHLEKAPTRDAMSMSLLTTPPGTSGDISGSMRKAVT